MVYLFILRTFAEYSDRNAPKDTQFYSFYQKIYVMAYRKCIKKAPDSMSERTTTEEQVKTALTIRIKVLDAMNQSTSELLDRYEAVHSEGECECSPEWKALALIQDKVESAIEQAKRVLNK